MARTGRKVVKKPSAAPWAWAAAALVATLVVAALVYSGGGDENGAVSGASRTFTPVDGFPDVHGLAVDPHDPSILYVATHSGLVRAVDDTDWSRVGDVRDDLMGFSLHPVDGDVMWSSGHPVTGGNMGVRKSTDGGFTWRTLALGGDVDFHAMTVSPADPDRLWGVYAGDLYASTDGGASWAVTNAEPPRIVTLSASPMDADTLFAGTPDGVVTSADGGASWTRLKGPVATTVAADPTDPSVLYAAAAGSVAKSTDGGASWDALPLDAHGGYVGYFAVAPSQPDVVYAATYDAGVYKSTDGGASWRTVKAPAG